MSWIRSAACWDGAGPPLVTNSSSGSANAPFGRPPQARQGCYFSCLISSSAIRLSPGPGWTRIPHVCSIALRVSTCGVHITKNALLSGLQVAVFGTAWQTCQRSCVLARQTPPCLCPSLCARPTRYCGLGYLRQIFLCLLMQCCACPPVCQGHTTGAKLFIMKVGWITLWHLVLGYADKCLDTCLLLGILPRRMRGLAQFCCEKCPEALQELSLWCFMLC